MLKLEKLKGMLEEAGWSAHVMNDHRLLGSTGPKELGEKNVVAFTGVMFSVRWSMNYTVDVNGPGHLITSTAMRFPEEVVYWLGVILPAIVAADAQAKRTRDKIRFTDA